MNSRSRIFVFAYIGMLAVILLMPFLIMRISDEFFSPVYYKKDEEDHHLGTSAGDVSYNSRVLEIFKSYVNPEELMIMSSEIEDSKVQQQKLDTVYQCMQQLGREGVLDTKWVEEEQASLMNGYYIINSDTGQELNYSTITWFSDGQPVNLIYDEDYKRIIRLSYKGDRNIFAGEDEEAICRAFEDYQGLDILEDWSFNGKRLICEKSPLIIECSFSEDGGIIQIIPRDIIIIGD